MHKISFLVILVNIWSKHMFASGHLWICWHHWQSRWRDVTWVLISAYSPQCVIRQTFKHTLDQRSTCLTYLLHVRKNEQMNKKVIWSSSCEIWLRWVFFFFYIVHSSERNSCISYYFTPHANCNGAGYLNGPFWRFFRGSCCTFSWLIIWSAIFVFC